MSKVIISAIAAMAAVAVTAGSVTISDSAHSDGARMASSGDGYYITELRKADRLPVKQQ